MNMMSERPVRMTDVIRALGYSSGDIEAMSVETENMSAVARGAMFRELEKLSLEAHKKFDVRPPPQPSLKFPNHKKDFQGRMRVANPPRDVAGKDRRRLGA